MFSNIKRSFSRITIGGIVGFAILFALGIITLRTVVHAYTTSQEIDESVVSETVRLNIIRLDEAYEAVNDQGSLPSLDLVL